MFKVESSDTNVRDGVFDPKEHTVKRFSILKAGGLVPLAILALALASAGGCAGSKHCQGSPWDDRNQANLAAGQALARQAPCKGDCGGGCEPHRRPQPQPQPPVVITKPCAADGSVLVEGGEWTKVVGADITGSIFVQDWTQDCDGSNRCPGELRSFPVRGTVSMPVTTRVGPFAVPVRLTARPGETCPPASKPEQK